jgi:hypothetical protein
MSAQSPPLRRELSTGITTPGALPARKRVLPSNTLQP